MTTTTTIHDLRQEAAALERVEHCISTNAGTYGAEEACRNVGCGDPAFADRRVLETVGGTRRETGPDADDAPGRMRQIDRAALSADRRRLAALHRRITSGR